MQNEIFLVDAFASTRFTGNPAAVVPLEGPGDEVWMQSLAMEMNQAETAYFWPEGESVRLRWFTPTLEVDLCGHATLATAHVIWSTGQVPEDRAIRFETRSGTLVCHLKDGHISMDFPSKPSSVVQLHPPITFPGWRVVQVGRSEYDVLIHLEGDQSLTEFTPDITLLKSLGGRGVILTRGVFQDGIDFESRFFAPNAGVPEDPATGSAHCTLAPYWAEFTGNGQTEWTGHQVSARGAMIKMTLRGDRVILSGNAITTIRGILTT